MRQQLKETGKIRGGRNRPLRRVWISGLLALAVAWLFYNRVWALSLAVPIYLGLGPYLKKQREQKAYGIFLGEFRDYLRLLASALRNGYSAENAFCTAGEELGKITPEDSTLLAAARKLSACIQLQVPLEEGLFEMASELGYEEAEDLADLMAFARRLGGDYSCFLEKSAQSIAARVELKEEMAANLAAKEYEQRLMSVMPLAVLSYVRMTAGTYLEPLYDSPIGMVIMSLCLGLYLGMFLLGERIIYRVMQV